MGRKLILRIFLFSCFIYILTILATCLYRYQIERNSIYLELSKTELNYTQKIKASLQKSDEKLLNKTLEDVLRIRGIDYVALVKGEATLSEAGSKDNRGHIIKEQDFSLSFSDQSAELITLRIFESYKGLFERIFSGLIFIFILQFISILSLCAFVWYLFESCITRHLKKVADYAQNINRVPALQPLILDGNPLIRSVPNELQDLVFSINEMRNIFQLGYKAYRESEIRLKNFTEVASDWLWEMDMALSYTYFSDRFYEITGYNSSAVIGYTQSRFYEGPANAPEWESHLHQLSSHQPFRDIVLRFTVANGDVRWVRLSGTPVFDGTGNFTGYRGIGTDITNEIQAREEAMEITLRFLNSIENVSDGIAFWDSSDRFVLCNRIFRTQAADAGHLLVLGTPYEQYIRGLLETGAINKPKGTHETWLNKHLRQRQNQPSQVEVNRNGRWLLIHEGRSEDGSTVSVTTDITALKQNEQQLQMVTDAVPILLAYVNDQLCFELINKEFEEWFGVSRESFLGSRLEKAFAPETFNRIKTYSEIALAGNFTRFQISFPIKGKAKKQKPAIRHIDASFTPNVDRNLNVSGFFIAAIDITNLINAEEGARKGELALSEQTQILRASFDAIAQGICVWDENLTLMAWNDAYKTFLGFPDDYLKRGMTIKDIMRKSAETGLLIDSHAVENSREWFTNVDAGVLPHTSELESADGRQITIKRYRVPGGGYVSIFTDVTEQVRIQEQLQHAQKLEAIGQLTGGIAHDFNNLLTIILGNLEMLEDQLTSQEQKNLVNTAFRASRRGAELTQRLLAFGRRQSLITELSDANALIEGIFELLIRTLGVTINIETILATPLWTIDIDRGQLENALLNLVINARDAMPNGGQLTIETANTTFTKDDALIYPNMKPGRYIEISVSDTGFGMTQHVAERAIEPFFTTKKADAGSGLGLSMVHGFVNQSGGHMNIYSQPDRGTVVRIFLPCTDGTPAQSPAHSQLTEQISAGEHILLIEDDPDVRQTSVNILRQLGYQVTETCNDAEAMSVVESGASIDLIFSDVFLYNSKSGPAIVEDIRILHPDIKILFTSGFAEDHFSKSEFQGVHTNFISKPYKKATLSNKLRSIFNEQKPLPH